MPNWTHNLIKNQTVDGEGKHVVVHSGVYMIATAGEFDKAELQLYVKIGITPEAPLAGGLMLKSTTTIVTLPECVAHVKVSGARMNTNISACISILVTRTRE